MKKVRFTEEQIIKVPKEGDAGAKTAELCRKHGISEATFCNWKSKYGGMTVSDARRLKDLDTLRRLSPALATALALCREHVGRDLEPVATT